jgi:hypothetical protein
MYVFGSGELYASPLTSTGGLGSPIRFGTLQDITVDLKVDMKELYGPNRYPVAVADGKGKIDITSKAARIDASMFGILFAGTTSSGGAVAQAVDESHVVPSTPFQVTLANTALLTTQLPYVQAVINGVSVTYTTLPSAGTPVAGQSCTINAGGTQLTFAAGDVGVTVLVSYFYSLTRTTAQTVSMPNVGMAQAPTFAVALGNITANQNNNFLGQMILYFNRAISPGLKMDFKLDDWEIPEFTMQCFADANGNVGSLFIVQ